MSLPPDPEDQGHHPPQYGELSPTLGMGGRGGYETQQQPPGYGEPYGGYDQGPAPPYAGWWNRVASYLIDSLVPLPFIAVGYAVLLGTRNDGDATTAGTLIFVLCIAGGIAADGWNRWFRAGRTGQSVGKSVMNTFLVFEATGQTIGAGKAFLRDVAHILDGICYIGYIQAAFQIKKQTFADMIMKTIVVKG
jgi:uncharacterized RDD family membrane protein YckC